MVKCSNCNSSALYEYKLTLKDSIFYCGKDLPKFLNERKKALLITTTDAFDTAQTEALDALRVAPSESTVVEELEPKKKATKKKAK